MTTALLVVGCAASLACVSDPGSPDGGLPDAAVASDVGAESGGTMCPSSIGEPDGGAVTTPTCTMPAKWLGKLIRKTPLVSVGRPVTTNAADHANKGLLVDGKYHVGSGLRMTPTASGPIWASIDVGTGYTTLLLGWQAAGFTDFGPSYYSGTNYKSATSPVGYVIKTSTDSSDGNDGTWTTVVTVADNPVRCRTHVIPFTGMRWLRFEVTAAGVTASGAAREVQLDEIELHDYSAVADGDLTDGWLLMGDSITMMSFDRNRGAGELDKLIAASRPGYAPALIEAGNGGEAFKHALIHLQKDNWIAYSEGLTFVTLAYGTNDSWGTTTPTSAKLEATLRSIITLLIDAKRVPILPRIPWNTVSGDLAEFNAVIDKLQQEFELPCGPDLYSVVAAHPNYVQGKASVDANCTVTYSGDGVHPQSEDAKNAIHQAYATVLLPLYSSL